MIGSEHKDERVAAPGTLAVAIAAPALELDGSGRVVAANGAARELWPGGPEGSTWRALFDQGRVPRGEAAGDAGRAADTPPPAARLARAGWSQWHWIPTPGAADGVAGLLVAADPPAPGSEGLGWQLFEALAENTPLIAGVKDRDGVIRYANPAWGSHLGVAWALLCVLLWGWSQTSLKAQLVDSSLLWGISIGGSAFYVLVASGIRRENTKESKD